jgi:hypothetical protein
VPSIGSLCKPLWWLSFDRQTVAYHYLDTI